MKVFVAYDSKYGNTKLAAENIAKGIEEAERVETVLGYVKEIDAKQVADFDVIVFGAPNHMGRPSRTMVKFVDELVQLDLKAKHFAVFGTYSGRVREVDRAMKKLETKVQNRLPNLRLVLPGLSVRVNGVKGPLVEGEIPKTVEFGKRIASLLVRNG